MTDCQHEWKPGYYGWDCSICDAMIPYGGEPWMDYDSEPDCCRHCGKELEDFSDLGCEHCDARHPLFGVLP